MENMQINDQKKQKILNEIASGKLTKTEIARQNGMTRDSLYHMLKKEKEEQERLTTVNILTEDLLREEILALKQENNRLKEALIFLKSMLNFVT